MAADNATGLAINPDQGAEFPGNPCAGQTGVRHEAQAFPCTIVDHGEDPEPPRGAEAVGSQVERPACVDADSSWHRSFGEICARVGDATDQVAA